MNVAILNNVLFKSIQREIGVELENIHDTMYILYKRL